MTRLFFGFLILSYLSFSNILQAQDSQAKSEKFTLNARAVGLGGSLVVQARDPSTIFWNPAALYGLKDRGMLISVNDPFTFDYVSVTQFVPLFGTFGFALSRVPSVSETIDRGTLAWGRKLFEHIAFGTKFDFLSREENWSATAGASLFIGNANVGSLDQHWRQFENSRLLDKLSLGISVQNIPLSEKVFEPSAMFGASYLLPVQGLLLNSGFHINEGEDTSHFGLGLELNEQLTLFSGIEEFNVDNFALGMGYTRDNFIFNFSYSKPTNKFLFTLAARISPSPDTMADRYYQKGVELLEHKRFRQAARQFHKYLDFELLNPKSDSVEVLVNHLEREFIRTRSTIDSLFALVESFLGQKNPSFIRAAYLLIKIKELDPDNFAATVKLNALKPAIEVLIRKTLLDGISAFETEQFISAKELFEAVLYFDKNNKTALKYMNEIDLELKKQAEEHFYRGIGYYRDKNFTIAKEEFKQALALNPDKTEAEIYLNRTEAKISEDQMLISKLLLEGQSLEQRAEYVDATNRYLEVLKMDPDNVDANVRLAKLKPKINQFIEKKYSEALRNYQSGDYSAAIEIFSGVLAIDPQHQNARRSLIKARNEKKARVNSYLQQAERAWQREDWSKVLQNASSALGLDPADERATQIKHAAQEKIRIDNLLDEGRRNRAEEKYLEAVAIFDNVLRLDPNNLAARTELDSTRSEINRLVEEDFRTGINLFTLERYERAIALWDKVLELDPNHKGAIEYKARATQRLQALRKIKR